jgi:predicted transcriptional regulator
MKIAEVLQIVEGQVVTADVDLDLEVCVGCAADLMSDVLAFPCEGALLLSGLINPQVVRTAEVAGVAALLIVRGKTPPKETVALAGEKRIPLLTTHLTMFEACGRLYQAGLTGCAPSNLSQ